MVENGFCEHTCINSIGGYSVRKIETSRSLTRSFIYSAPAKKAMICLLKMDKAENIFLIVNPEKIIKI